MKPITQNSSSHIFGLRCYSFKLIKVANCLASLTTLKRRLKLEKEIKYCTINKNTGSSGQFCASLPMSLLISFFFLPAKPPSLLCICLLTQALVSILITLLDLLQSYPLCYLHLASSALYWNDLSLWVSFYSPFSLSANEGQKKAWHFFDSPCEHQPGTQYMLVFEYGAFTIIVSLSSLG